MQGKLGAKLFKCTNGIRCQPVEPNSCEALQHSGDGPAHNLVYHSLKDSIWGIRNFGGKGNNKTDAMNGESILWTKSSWSLDTRPLRAFIKKSIRSFIICIFVTIWRGAISVLDGRLVSCRSCLLGVLLPSGPSWFLLSALVPSWSSYWVFSATFFWCSCSSRSWFWLVRHSTAVRFMTLIIGGGCHRTSKYHATFFLGSGEYGLFPEFP